MSNFFQALKKDEVLDKRFQKRLAEKLESTHYNKMLEFRKKLPAYDKKDEILNLLRNNQVIVISGETGMILFSWKYK